MTLMGILMMTAVVISVVVVMATLMFSMFFVSLALVLTFLPTVLMLTAFVISMIFIMTTGAMCMGMLRQSLGLMMECLTCPRPQVLHAIPGDVHPAQLLFQ